MRKPIINKSFLDGDVLQVAPGNAQTILLYVEHQGRDIAIL